MPPPWRVEEGKPVDLELGDIGHLIAHAPRGFQQVVVKVWGEDTEGRRTNKVTVRVETEPFRKAYRKGYEPGPAVIRKPDDWK